jgi:hypothetical protein
MTLDGLLSGTIGVLIGASLGPMITAAITTRWSHRSSLRAIRGEIRANLMVLRGHALATKARKDVHIVPIAVGVSFEVMGAVASALATWGEGTLHHVALHYAWLRQFQQLADAQAQAAVALTAADHLRTNIIPANATVSSLFDVACSKRDVAITMGVVALEWIDNELQRMADYDPPRPFDYAKALNGRSDAA